MRHRLALVMSLCCTWLLAPAQGGLAMAGSAARKHDKAKHGGKGGHGHGKKGKDPRTRFRAGRAPKNKRHDPIPPPPPPPAIKPHGLFRGLVTPAQQWSYQVRVDGRLIEELPKVTLRVVSVSRVRGGTLAELALFVGDDALDSLGDKAPAALLGLDPRLRLLESEADKRHSLTFLPALPTDPKQLKAVLAQRPDLFDPPSPSPDLWRGGSYTGSQERRVDFPSGIALASCYRWGKLADGGTLDGHELCQDLEHGPVVLEHRAGGHTTELLLADGDQLDDVPPPPSER